MNDRAGFFAGLADILTAMCVYYVAAAVLIMNKRGWGVHLGWLLLSAAACAFVFAWLLKKPRSTPLLTAVTGGLVAASLGLYLLVSTTPAKFGYIFLLCVGAGMAAGMPLYFCLHRPQVMKHLNYLEVLILAVLGLLLTRQALGIDGLTAALMIAVLLLDAAAAVGLRMSDGDAADGRNAFKASLVALAAAGILALVIALFVMLFSRSGGLTDSVLHGLGAFFAAIGGGIERAFERLAKLLYREEEYDAALLDTAPPSIAESELENGGMGLSVNTTALGIVLVVLVIAAAVAVAILLRKRRAVRDTGLIAAAPESAAVRRSGGTLDALWQRLKEVLRFRWTAFVRRDTPAGVLVFLERRARRVHAPRQTGESMRAFLMRMDPSGGMDDLADALDREYYGGGGGALGAKRCRELRRYIRRVVRRSGPRRGAEKEAMA